MNPAYNGSKSFFLDAVGGTCKIYVLNAVIAAFRAAGIISIAAASSNYH